MRSQVESGEDKLTQNKLLELAYKHKITILIALAILIAFVLISISMSLYNSSGASQLDLSRPEYQSVIGKIEHRTDLAKYPSFGEINQKAFDDFDKLYKKRVQSTLGVDAFGGDTLSDKALGLPKID